MNAPASGTKLGFVRRWWAAGWEAAAALALPWECPICGGDGEGEGAAVLSGLPGRGARCRQSGVSAVRDARRPVGGARRRVRRVSQSAARVRRRRGARAVFWADSRPLPADEARAERVGRSLGRWFARRGAAGFAKRTQRARGRRPFALATTMGAGVQPIRGAARRTGRAARPETGERLATHQTHADFRRTQPRRTRRARSAMRLESEARARVCRAHRLARRRRFDHRRDVCLRRARLETSGRGARCGGGRGAA